MIKNVIMLVMILVILLLIILSILNIPIIYSQVFPNLESDNLAFDKLSINQFLSL